MIWENTSHGIIIRVEPQFLEAQSIPAEQHYVWAYHVAIENTRETIVQLIHRTWVITDDNGQTSHVSGPGVIGKQPRLASGQIYTYTSGVPLPTPSGIMSGYYQMRDSEGLSFDAQIPAFSLDSPYDLALLH